ncbi:hypothetical protein [Nocardioides sp. WS12]|uniref:hypothetical protein n=1 Tax=Nocardioides sp. WS12 TaxID=2486272 RepID=UPI0015FD4A8A|nr:hypothetical protein [Nocardioides sp. WS12]
MSAVSLADVKTYLNITVPDYDTELQGFVDAAEAVIGEKCGSLTSVSRTDRVTGGYDSLVLPVSPVVSLTSVIPVNGSALTLGDLYLSASAGVVTYNSGSAFSSAAYDVTFQYGRSSLPSDLALAVKELVRHLWMTQRGPTGSPSTGGGDTPAPPAFLLPWRVLELIAPHLQAGIA